MDSNYRRKNVHHRIFDRSINSSKWSSKLYLRDSFVGATELRHEQLKGHYGCVNAVEFSHRGGDFLASGGDDRRVLLWRVDEVLTRPVVKPRVMVAEHHSNIFCLAWDYCDRTILSGGNDEQVIVHDVETGDTKDVYLHDDAIYSISVDPTNDFVFASACDDGTVQLFDLRRADATETLASSNSPFHSVMHNPAEPRIFVTANGRDGAQLWDVRVPNSPLLLYGASAGHRRKSSGRNPRQQACMFARFNSDGTRVLVLRRRLPPALYKTESSSTWCQFDHPGYYNSCTLKSCSFGGDADQYVIAGSDDFNVYSWKTPSNPEEVDHWVGNAHHVLRGHRSIVNQVRFNEDRHVVCSSGVEKVIRLWSALSPSSPPDEETSVKADVPAPTLSDATAVHPDAQEDAGEEEEGERSASRSMFTHEEYIDLVRTTGQSINHDYSSQSVEEDPRMIAFFDSLVQRELEGWSSDSSGEEMVGPMMVDYVPGDRESRPTIEEEVEAESLSRVVITTPEQSSDDDDGEDPTPRSPTARASIFEDFTRGAPSARERVVASSAGALSTGETSQPRTSGVSRRDKKTISELIASRRSDYLKLTSKVTERERMSKLNGKRRTMSSGRDEDADDEEEKGEKPKRILKARRKRKKVSHKRNVRSIDFVKAENSDSSSDSSDSSRKSSSSSSSSSTSSSSTSSSSSSSTSSSSLSAGSPKKTKLEDFAEKLLESMPTQSLSDAADNPETPGGSRFRSRPGNREKRNYRKKEQSDDDGSDK